MPSGIFRHISGSGLAHLRKAERGGGLNHWDLCTYYEWGDACETMPGGFWRGLAVPWHE